MEDSQLKRSSKTPSISEWLDELCEYYMAIGVPYDEFWFGDYCKLKYYEKLYFNRQKQLDSQMWTQGAYIYQAFSAVLARAFGGDKDATYPKQPFSLAEAPEERTPEELQADIYAQLKATIQPIVQGGPNGNRP